MVGLLDLGADMNVADLLNVYVSAIAPITLGT